jgi:hypothetical protein
MTDTANQTKLAKYIHVDTPKRNSPAKTGRTLSRIFNAILGAMHESRRMQAEREIARFFARQQGSVSIHSNPTWPTIGPRAWPSQIPLSNKRPVPLRLRHIENE